MHSQQSGRTGDESRPVLNGVAQWVKVVGNMCANVPLIVLHGGPGGNHYAFERVPGPGLEAARTVVYHEQRGSGRSDASATPDAYTIPLLVDDLNALLNWLGTEQADLLGYSFGGGLALEYAVAHPTRVRRLVLEAPVLHLHDQEIVASQLTGFQHVSRGEVAQQIATILEANLSEVEKLDAVWDLVDSDTVDRFLFQSAEVATYNRELWEQSGLINTGVMHRALKAQPPSSTAQQLSEIQIPTLLLAGRHDRNVPLSSVERMSRTLPQAWLKVFENSAHFSDMEETESYVQRVSMFLGNS